MGLSLHINALKKSYGGKNVLEECSYEFHPGLVYGLMGANGCGKSTLLRVCALLEPSDTGEIAYYFDGHHVGSDIGLKRRITLMLPRVGVLNTTVFKNVGYGLWLRGMPKQLIQRKTEAVLEAVGLAHKSQQNALTLSSGETQRLGIARAIVLEPEVLFLDEPTASIDEENTAIVEKIIVSLKNAGKTSIIIATHDREQATRLADKVLCLRNGKIEEK